VSEDVFSLKLEYALVDFIQLSLDISMTFEFCQVSIYQCLSARKKLCPIASFLQMIEVTFKYFVPFIAQIREHCKELQLTDAQIREMMSRLLEDIQLGLGKDTHETSIVKCFVTYVQDLPNGTGKLRNV
jgi:Hexokinase.